MPNDAFPRSSLPALPFRERLTQVSFNLPANLEPQQWQDIGRALGRMDGSMSWWVGDWWAYEGHSYGDRKAMVEAEEWDGPSFQGCRDAASVCRSFAETSRRRDVLTFNHHREVAALSPDIADRLLDWCEEPLRQTGRPRTIRELREEVRKAKIQLAQGWTASQLERKATAERGSAVVASMRDGGDGRRLDEALLTWAEGEERLVRIDRQGPFGNPFVMPEDGDRGEVIAKFEKFYWPHKPGLLTKAWELVGKGTVLGCWCHPEPCHGDVIAETVNSVAAGKGTAQEIADRIAAHDG